MGMNYIDLCIERAEKATEGPWEYDGEDLLIPSTPKEGKKCYGFVAHDEQRQNDFPFIAHSRTDVPELARRLKKACEYLRLESVCSRKKILNTIADELEAMPEGK